MEAWAAVRRDAAENRQKLIEAAREIMREQGGDVALEAIAERAGIGRGTVYRNFEDRLQLYGAVLEADLEIVREDLRKLEPRGDLIEAMRRLVELMAVYDKFRGSLPHLSDFRADGCQQEAMFALLETPMRQAKEAGRLREDATVEELLLACRMVASGWRLDLEPDRDTALSKRLALILRGLGTAGCAAEIARK